MKNRNYYEKAFASYPDLVTTEQARIMLGGVGINTIYYLLHNNRLEHYHIRGAFLIPKAALIGYILGDHYNMFKEKLKHQV